MGRIKILQFPMANAYGGKTQYVLNNWKFIDKDKFQFDFATTGKDLHFKEEVIKEGCKVHFISCSAEQDLEQFTKEYIRILDEGYDVVHLHTSYWKSFIVEELAKQYGVSKIIVHSHSTMIDILDDKKREEAIKLHNLMRSRLTEDIATDFTACSHSAADWLFGDMIPKSKIKILTNAIDAQKFYYNEKIRGEYRTALGLEGNIVIGHIGRFTYMKNHVFLIELYKEINKMIPNTRLVLVGVGELEENIHSLVHEYGLDNKVIFLKNRNDINNLMQAFDFFLLPSYFEGLSIALVEAQAAGLNCITSQEVSVESKITDNLEFLPLDINLWINAFKKSYQYKRENEEENIIKARYDIHSQIKEIEKLYLYE